MHRKIHMHCNKLAELIGVNVLIDLFLEQKWLDGSSQKIFQCSPSLTSNIESFIANCAVLIGFMPNHVGCDVGHNHRII